MTKRKFLRKMKMYGIPLKLLNIHINEINNSSYSTYILKEEEKWSIFEVDERNNADLVFSADCSAQINLAGS